MRGAIIYYFGINKDEVHLIDPSSTNINISYEIGADGSITVDVTPNSMNTTSTRNDTGDGLFCKITAGGTATGDFTLTVEALTANPSTTNTRSMTVTIADDSAQADDVIITIIQAISPI